MICTFVSVLDCRTEPSGFRLLASAYGSAVLSAGASDQRYFHGSKPLASEVFCVRDVAVILLYTGLSHRTSNEDRDR